MNKGRKRQRERERGGRGREGAKIILMQPLSVLSSDSRKGKWNLENRKRE